MDTSKLVELNLMLGGYLDDVAENFSEESSLEIICSPRTASILSQVQKDYFNLKFFEIIDDENFEDNVLEIGHYNLYTNDYIEIDKIEF